jgi:hypothetical protein
MRRSLFAMVPLASVLLAALPAHAGENDLALNRLSYAIPQDPTMVPVQVGGCGTEQTNFALCAPDNQLFVNLINQLGGVLAPALLAPAGTLGYNGLYFGFEPAISGVRGEGDYWHRGTEGGTMNRVGSGTQTRRDRMPNFLFVQRFHVRKAFPYGFELGLQTSWLQDSGLVALGLDIRWALFEGFRTGIGYLPDFAVRGSVNTLVGNPQLYLTVVGIDTSLSKQFPIAGLFTLTPYAGGQALMIFGDSTVIDATPTRSAYQECPRRRLVFGMTPSDPSTLVCEAGSNTPMGAPNDSLNEMVFLQTRILRWRAFAGLRFRYRYLSLTGEFTMDVPDRPSFLNDADAGRGQGPQNDMRMATDVTFDAYRQWTASLGVGLQF